MNGKVPANRRDTWHRAPPDTAHLRLSPGKLHVLMQRSPPSGYESPWQAQPGLSPGHSSAWCQPMHCARTLGAWGSSSGCHCGTVNSCQYLDLQRLLLSILHQPEGGLGLLVWGQLSTGWPERAPLSPHLCQPVSLWQVAFALLAQTRIVKKLEALKKQERLAAGRY